MTICWFVGCTTGATSQIMGTSCCQDHVNATWDKLSSLFGHATHG